MRKFGSHLARFDAAGVRLLTPPAQKGILKVTVSSIAGNLLLFRGRGRGTIK
jgi:hypothetical protein